MEIINIHHGIIIATAGVIGFCWVIGHILNVFLGKLDEITDKLDVIIENLEHNNSEDEPKENFQP